MEKEAYISASIFTQSWNKIELLFYFDNPSDPFTEKVKNGSKDGENFNKLGLSLSVSQNNFFKSWYH